MGWDADYDEAWDEAEAFFAYINDPESDLTTILTIEDALEVRL
ncbi:hypothetical protein ACFYXW_27780 [Streptomyces sp. NPDC001981]